MLDPTLTKNELKILAISLMTVTMFPSLSKISFITDFLLILVLDASLIQSQISLELLPALIFFLP